MKPFDLEKALAGEPVKLRDGSKVVILKDLSTNTLWNPSEEFYLLGFVVNKGGYLDIPAHYWTKNGKYLEHKDSHWDIIGMWEEPRPTVTLTLPCPLKEPQSEMWFIQGGAIIQSRCSKLEHLDANFRGLFDAGFYFASKEVAQAWLDALKNSRR